MSYPKEKAIENLRNTTEYLQTILLGLCLASAEEAVPIDSVQKIHATLGSCIVDLTDFTKEFIKDRKNQRRLDSILVKLISSGVAMAFNVAEKYYKSKKEWSQKRWQAPYPYAAQIRHMFSHGFVWSFAPQWVENYKKEENQFPIVYKHLKVEESWNGRKARVSDLTPLGDFIVLIEEIIEDISKS